MREVVVHGNYLAEQPHSDNLVERIKDYLKGMSSREKQTAQEFKNRF